MKWEGVQAGFRTTVKTLAPRPDRKDTIDVLLFGFESAARNAFIRKMPQSYKYLKDDLQATILTRCVLEQKKY